MEDKRNKRLPHCYRVAARYIRWREAMSLCQKRMKVDTCRECKAASYCQIHRSYAEADEHLSFMNRRPS